MVSRNLIAIASILTLSCPAQADHGEYEPVPNQAAQDQGHHKLAASMGYVFASISLDGPGATYFLIYKETTTGYSGRLAYSSGPFSAHSPFDDLNRGGDIVFDTLPVGHYAITAWGCSGGAIHTGATLSKPIEFDVKPKTKTYLGGYYFEATRHWGILMGTSLTVEDHRDRDVALNASEHPEMRGVDLEDLAWSNLPLQIEAKETSRTVDTMIPIIVKH